MVIQYYIKNVFGIDKRYISDEEQYKAFLKLTGRKTVTDEDIQILKVFGCTFEEVKR